MDQSHPLALENQPFTQAELAGIEKAIAQANAGQLVDLEDVLAWLDSLDTDTPLPMPEPK